MATRIHVGNLPYTATEEQLEQLFGEVGTVVSVSLPKDRISGRPRGFGFVEMANSAEAEEAIRKFDGYEMENRSLRVEIAREREPRAPGFGSTGPRRTGYGRGWQKRGRQHRGRGPGMAA